MKMRGWIGGLLCVALLSFGLLRLGGSLAPPDEAHSSPPVEEPGTLPPLDEPPVQADEESPVPALSDDVSGENASRGGGVALEDDASSSSCSIRGSVVDFETRVPLAGVNITVLNYDESEATAASVATEQDGTFLINRLPLGRYRVSVWRGALEVASRTVATYRVPGAPEDLDFHVGELLVGPKRTVKIAVRNEQGGPVPAAQVFLTRGRMTGMEEERLPASSTLLGMTDSSGVLVGAVGEHYGGEHLLALTADSLAFSKPIEFASAGSIALVEIEVPASVIIEIQVTTAAEQAPVEGATVGLINREHPWRVLKSAGRAEWAGEGAALRERLERRTDAEGVARLTGLPTDGPSWDVWARTVGGGRAHARSVPTGKLVSSGLTLEVRAPQAVRSVEGRILNEEGLPLEGAKISSAGIDAKTKKDGTFILRDQGNTLKLPLTLDASMEGYADERVRVRKVDSTGEATMPPLRLSRGRSTWGVVVDQFGVPVEGATITVANIVGNPVRVVGATSDASGAFRTVSLPMDRTFLLWGKPAEPSGWLVPGTRSIRGGEGPIEYVLPRETRELIDVTVDVVRHDTGAGITPLRVLLSPRAQYVPDAVRTQPRADAMVYPGKARFSDVPVGPWAIWVTTPKGFLGRADIDVSSEGGSRFTCVVADPASGELTIRRSTALANLPEIGRKKVRVRLRLVGADDTPPLAALRTFWPAELVLNANDEGRMSYGGLVAGEYEVLILRPPGLSAAKPSVFLSPGENEPLEVEVLLDSADSKPR